MSEREDLDRVLSDLAADLRQSNELAEKRLNMERQGLTTAQALLKALGETNRNLIRLLEALNRQ